MKILQLTKKFPYPAHDGESLAILNLTRSFHNAGHEVTVLAMSTPKHPAGVERLPDDVKKLATFYAVEVDTSISYVNAFFNIFTSSSYNLERFFSPRFKEGLRQILIEGDFDLIQLEGLYLAPYLNTIRSITKAPVVMRSHNLEYEIWEKQAKGRGNWLSRQYKGMLARRLRFFEEGALNSYSALVPISPRDAKVYREMGLSIPMHVTPFGLQLEKYTNGSGSTEAADAPFSIGYLGALDWRPNTEGLEWFLKEVWPGLRQKHKGLSLEIAGRNGEPDFLKMQVEGVKIVGEVDKATNFLQKHDLIIVPLLSGSGMRIKVLEAMALGKTVVSTSLGAAGIAARNGEDIFLADTPTDFAAAIGKCISSADLLRKTGENARFFARENHDNERLASELIAFYSNTFAL